MIDKWVCVEWIERERAKSEAFSIVRGIIPNKLLSKVVSLFFSLEIQPTRACVLCVHIRFYVIRDHLQQSVIESHTQNPNTHKKSFVSLRITEKKGGKRKENVCLRSSIIIALMSSAQIAHTLSERLKEWDLYEDTHMSTHFNQTGFSCAREEWSSFILARCQFHLCLYI